MSQITVNGYSIEHNYPYDPTYGYDYDDLLQVSAPPGPDGFEEFWRARYRRICDFPAKLTLSNLYTDKKRNIADIQYETIDGFKVGGWLVYPKKGEIRRGFVVGHGYGGREQPDLDWPFNDAAMLYPCARGFNHSAHPHYPSDCMQHVIAGIEDPEKYLIGKCVEDLWTGVSALLKYFPEIEGNIHYMGGSFGGGLGALAVPWDERITRAQFTIPTFGCQPLRLQLLTGGSGAAVRAYARRHPGTAEKTLAWYDAATAARYIKIPTHSSCALFDPAVAPPGQFGIYNAIPDNDRHLFIRTTGHHDFPESDAMLQEEFQDIVRFFTG